MKYVLIALLLTGCTTTEMVRDEGERSKHALRQGPNDAAGCFARNIEKARDGMIAAVRSSGNGEMEVIVRSGGSAEHVFAISQIAPATSGSIAQVWLKPGWFVRRGEFVPAMVAGC